MKTKSFLENTCNYNSMYINKLYVFFSFLILLNFTTWAQKIPDNKILNSKELIQLLKEDKRNQLKVNGEITEDRLAEYFKEKFSERFFYNYKNFYPRLENYNELYHNKTTHKNRAIDHLNKYNASTQWVLPFNYQNGDAVNAYALRHLARQHKMVDVAINYFNEDKDPVHIKYFVNQMKSLNNALLTDKYETIKDGNGVYEVFRSGYRIFNWLWIHNMFLNEETYNSKDQIQTIATLLQHGQHLYERNDHFRPGNHQTKGMSALAVLSILLSDFEETNKWYERSMRRLGEHLDKEINSDGFQFERTVHYHMSDINNYFYVYQLAKINKIVVDKTWEEKLKILFTTLTKIAYPDKSAPVLQDDTEIPWAEKNDISGALTLGYLLFDNPEYGYFASNKVKSSMYWYLNSAQIEQLNAIKKKQPTYGSLAFDKTHYYIMRQGWNSNDKMMIVSAGLDSEKPDHQHADMLGIQAIANGQIILPNYQVRYSLSDFDFFKNSMVKNVALVDNELQGKEWTSNKGGSGFGKFKKLPDPKVIAWNSNSSFDLFVGSHNGFEENDVDYSRQVIFVKDAFWIVKDNFKSNTVHDYKQVWQGHYTSELGPNLIRASFSDAAGSDIVQLNKVDHITSSGTRGKKQTLITKINQNNFNFLTVIFPYKGYNNRVNETKEQVKFNDWKVNDSDWKTTEEKATILSNNEEFYFFDVLSLKRDNITIQSSIKTDLHLKIENENLKITVLGDTEVSLNINTVTTRILRPGEEYSYLIKKK